MSLKDVNWLLLQAFTNANPSRGDLTTGTVSGIKKVDNSDNYTGAIADGSGNVLAANATWKPGTVKGVLKLDPGFKPAEQDAPGTTPGIFTKADGSLYFVLYKKATFNDVNNVLGYSFTGDQQSVDETNGQIVFTSHLFTENVPAVFVDLPFVDHVDLPTE